MKRIITSFKSLSRRGLIRQRTAEKISRKHIQTFVIKRWDTLIMLQRQIAGWLLLVGLLVGGAIAYQWYVAPSTTNQTFIEGGVYAEGVRGPLDTLNPLYASTSAEVAASELFFAGLLSYDQSNQLRGELAESWMPLEGGKAYSVTLRPGLTWHDGAPLTADDVIFTVNLVKDPRTRTRLIDSWRDITVTKIDDKTVRFDLPNVYAPFPHALTLAILPQHTLAGVSPQSLREANFNRRPIGSGPFAFQRLQTINAEQGRMVVYAQRFNAYTLGRTKVDKFQLHTYAGSSEIITALDSGQINAASGVDPGDLTAVTKSGEFIAARTALYHGVYAFLNNDSPVLADAAVRRVLAGLVDTGAIRRERGSAQDLQGPLLAEHYAGLPRFPRVNEIDAAAQLEAAGWVKGVGGLREKAGQKLRLTIAAPRDGNYDQALEHITAAWRKVGVEVITQLVDTSDIQQNVIVPRAYDVLIYELAVGADPDGYAFWHSSQADPRGLNLSNYRSDIADELLVSGQLRTEPQLRERKYRDFVNRWVSDAPAIPLYRPEIGYVMSREVQAIERQNALVDSVTRYGSVLEWGVRSGRVLQTP